MTEAKKLHITHAENKRPRQAETSFSRSQNTSAPIVATRFLSIRRICDLMGEPINVFEGLQSHATAQFPVSFQNGVSTRFKICARRLFKLR